MPWQTLYRIYTAELQGLKWGSASEYSHTHIICSAMFPAANQRLPLPDPWCHFFLWLLSGRKCKCSGGWATWCQPGWQQQLRAVTLYLSKSQWHEDGAVDSIIKHSLYRTHLIPLLACARARARVLKAFACFPRLESSAGISFKKIHPR